MWVKVDSPDTSLIFARVCLWPVPLRTQVPLYATLGTDAVSFILHEMEMVTVLAGRSEAAMVGHDLHQLLPCRGTRHHGFPHCRFCSC